MNMALSTRVTLAVAVLSVVPVGVLGARVSGPWLTIAVFSLLTMIVTWWLVREAEQRIGLLTQALSRAGRGEFSVRVRPRGGDEIANALSAFNVMMSRVALLRERTEELERIGAWQEFARRLAHEIKNPLTPIQLAVQEVARKYNGTDVEFARTLKTAKEIVEEEIATLQRLVTAFSEFARLPDVKRVRCDLREFVSDLQETKALLHASALSPLSASGVIPTLVVEPGETPVFARIDRIMLRRAIENVLQNAADAGATKIVLRLEHGEPQRSDNEQNSVRIVIEDNGEGIPPDVAARVFAPYFTTKATGTGLGLAIVRKIALDHDGDVILDQAYTQGARFIFALPVSDERSSADTRFVTLRASHSA